MTNTQLLLDRFEEGILALTKSHQTRLDSVLEEVRVALNDISEISDEDVKFLTDGTTLKDQAQVGASLALHVLTSAELLGLDLGGDDSPYDDLQAVAAQIIQYDLDSEVTSRLLAEVYYAFLEFDPPRDSTGFSKIAPDVYPAEAAAVVIDGIRALREEIVEHLDHIADLRAHVARLEDRS